MLITAGDMMQRTLVCSRFASHWVAIPSSTAEKWSTNQEKTSKTMDNEATSSLFLMSGNWRKYSDEWYMVLHVVWLVFSIDHGCLMKRPPNSLIELYRTNRKRKRMKREFEKSNREVYLKTQNIIGTSIVYCFFLWLSDRFFFFFFFLRVSFLRVGVLCALCTVLGWTVLLEQDTRVLLSQIVCI